VWGEVLMQRRSLNLGPKKKVGANLQICKFANWCQPAAEDCGTASAPTAVEEEPPICEFANLQICAKFFFGPNFKLWRCSKTFNEKPSSVG